MRGTIAGPIALLLLGFTLTGAARAERAQASRAGTSLRAGTTVGFVGFGDEAVSALGLQTALGYKLGPLALEVEYDRLALLEYRQGDNRDRGRLVRLGLNGRLFISRLGRRFEPDSLLLLFLEAGAGRQRGRFASGDGVERNDVTLGGGFLLDHRVAIRRSGSSLRNVGWHFGWRLTAARRALHSPAFFAACRSRGDACPRQELGPGHDLGLLVSSSMSFSW